MTAVTTQATKPHTLTRAQMLRELSPKVRAIIEKADPKTKAFLLDGWRFGRAGMLK